MDVERVLPELEKRLQDDMQPTRECSLAVEEEANCTPIVVCKSTSRHDLTHWLSKNEDKLQRWEYKPLTRTRGGVVVYSLPTVVHNITAGEVVDMIREQMLLMNPSARLMRTLHAGGSTRYDVGDRHQAPDQCLIPAGAPPNTYPNLVVEVAYKHESWQNLLEKLRRWMRPATSVQIAIGVQVGLIRRRITVMRRKVSFNYKGGEEHHFLSEVVDFDFGHGHEIRFPLSALFFGVALPDALGGQDDTEIVLDLVELREAINAVVPKNVLGRNK
ncbi:hypothetical protein PHYPSEUDO_009014 [Phytophthora pseudosyringae]|uniref:Restriction endonuclease domain-containing protein n=1 Tax=Phytophthora pseudosyringae TaxID=221518 RepID=A0A8T1W7V8_9STRA|nr:hypothetical protein PHYPSEUDO_009014 [Phytophthora pseudosyringae]